MKRVVFCITCLLVSASLSAQDVLITKEGDVIQAYELEIGGSSIYYKSSEGDDATLQKMAKSDVLMIKYKDGRKEMLGDSQPAKPQVQTPAQAETQTQTVRQDNAANRKAIDAYILDVGYTKPASSNKANIAFCQCIPQQGSQLANDEAELIFQSSSIMYHRPFDGMISCHNKLRVSIRNKTNKLLYIDLGGTFFRRGRTSETCYVPSATTAVSSTSTGGSVNMGAVSGALGIGGAAGTLASGVTLGSSTTNSSSTTVYAQRVVAIPPMTETEIGDFELFNFDDTKSYPKGVSLKSKPLKADYYVLYLSDPQLFPTVGEIKRVNNTDYLQFGMFVTYANDEAITNPKILNATFCLDRIIGAHAKKNMAIETIPPEYLTQNYSQSVYFIANTDL